MRSSVKRLRKRVTENVKYANECVKRVVELKEDFKMKEKQNKNKYIKKQKEIVKNSERIKRELKVIEITRPQEYVNYCIFISSD